MMVTPKHAKRKALDRVLHHASGDKRFRILDTHLKRHQHRADALIEILHKAQELVGFLEDDLLLYSAHARKLPPGRVYGVATAERIGASQGFQP